MPKNSVSQADYLPLARATYGADAVVACEGISFARCEFGGANSFVFYRMRLTMSVPVYRERLNDAACPESGPGEWVEVEPAVYATCRHPLNGRDPNVACEEK